MKPIVWRTGLTRAQPPKNSSQLAWSAPSKPWYRDDLREAESFFRSALAVRGDHPDRANKIREELKKHCKEVSGKEPPGWGQAQGALEMITSLGLQTDATQLFEADFWLKQAKIDKGFEMFDNLPKTPYPPDIQSQLDLEISRIVCDHVAQYAQKGQWEPAKKIIEKLEGQWPKDDKRQLWLETASRILTAAEAQGVKGHGKDQGGEQPSTETPGQPTGLERIRDIFLGRKQ